MKTLVLVQEDNMQQKVSIFYFNGSTYHFLCSTLAAVDEENTALIVFNEEKLEVLKQIIEDALEGRHDFAA